MDCILVPFSRSKRKFRLKESTPLKSVRLIAPLLVCLLVVPLAWCQGNVEQQIAALSDQFSQAFGKADTGFMEKYFTDDFTAIHSDGKLTPRAQEIDNIKSGTLKWASVDVHEKKIRVYGDTAVVISLASSNGTLSGKPYSGDFRTTQLWVKHKGDWKCAAFQSTRVASASQ
jgi:ketosteroid isomerase-like protein